MFNYNQQMTEDDVIQHLLMRLNTDFANCCLDVKGFCEIKSFNSIDRRMVKKVISKMYEHDVAMPCSGNDQQEEMIEITSKGIQVFDQGGWKKYLTEYEKKLAEKNNQNPTTITNYGNMVYGNNNTDINQESLVRDLQFHQIEKQYPNTPESINQSDSGIINKIYNLANHQVVGGLILAGLIALISWYFSK